MAKASDTTRENNGPATTPDTDASTDAVTITAEDPTLLDDRIASEPHNDLHNGTPAANSDKSRSTWALINTLLSIVLLLLLGAAAWLGQQQLKAQQQAIDTAQSQQQQQLQKALQALNNDTQRQLGALEASQRQVQRAQAELRQAINSVRQFAAEGPQAWRLAEVEYLLRLANLRLRIEQDSATAQTLLQAADQQLQKLANPRYRPLREQILDSQQQLAQRPQNDKTAQLHALDQLIAQADRLPLPNETPQRAHSNKASVHPQHTNEDTAKDNNVGFIDTLRDKLQALIIVRRHNKPVEALISPEQQQLLHKLLKVQLESARLAIERGQIDTIQSALARASHTLKSQYDNQAQATQQALRTLSQLTQQSQQTPLPDLIPAIEMLHRLQQSATAPQQP